MCIVHMDSDMGRNVMAGEIVIHMDSDMGRNATAGECAVYT